ncbi:MAG: ABC transporter permease [Pseudomonadales bacterium]
MNLLVKSQIRFLRQAPWSAATALLGVALGVASVVAVHLISAQVERSLDEAAPPHLAGLTHLLDRPGIRADDYFDLRDGWRNRPATAITALVPLVEGHVLLDGRSVLVLGADWLAMPPASGRGTTTGGAAWSVPLDVIVGEALLVDGSLERRAGDRVSVAGRSFRVAEELESGLGPALIADIAAAQQMLQLPPQSLSLVGMAVADPWESWRRWLNRLMPGFAAGFPQPSALALDALLSQIDGDAAAWRAIPVTAERPSAAFARAVLFNLGALGTLALLVAWFLIYQVGVIWRRRQQLLLQRLHAVGVPQRSLRLSFLALFAGLGSLATVAGMLLGVALAELLVSLSAPGVGAGRAGAGQLPAVDAWVVFKAVVSGLGVCLIGGYAAYSRASSERPWPWPWRWLLVPALLLMVALGILREDSGVFGGFMAIFAMSLLGALLVSPTLMLLRRAVTVLPLALPWRLALREVAWHPRALRVAMAALTLAVATGIGIGLMVESFRADFTRMLESRLAGDLYIYQLGEQFAEVDAWLQAQPEVAAVTRFGAERVRLQGLPVELGYTRFDRSQSARYGFDRALDDGEALLSERLARDLRLAPGDLIDVADGRLRVAGVFPDFGATAGRLLADIASLDALGLWPRFDRFTVDLQPQAELAERLARRFPEVELEARGAVRAQALRIFDRTFAITQALTLLALVVAVVGMYNALTALRLNQARTTRLLHAQGLSAAEARQISLIRSLVVGGIAVLLALPLGIAMAWTLCSVLNPRSFGWTVTLHLPLAGWLLPLLLGLGAALLAGAVPAPRERGALDEAT